MAVLSVSHLSKSYGADLVLNDISLQLHAGERVGLVGPNGAGKTTLLKIIMGQEGADSGSVTLARGKCLSYLEQKPVYTAGKTMEQEIRAAFASLDLMAIQIRELAEKMTQPEITKDKEAVRQIMDTYGKLCHRYEEEGGYTADVRLRAVTRGLGFAEEDLPRPVETFSGGERTRLRLARLLLEEPDILLLDEPTNHLDLASVEWLENYLCDLRSTVLVVSHDRYFLDRVAGRILALSGRRIKSYSGNYAAYVLQRDMEKITMDNAYRKQQEYIQKEASYIRSLGTGEREKRQAKSREKRLDKLDKVDRPASEKVMALDFAYAGRSGEIVARLHNVKKCFGEKTVLDQVSVEIRWGDRVALIGPNGSGKTTFLRLITGGLIPDAGSLYLGPSVRIIYFDQYQQTVDCTGTPLSEIMSASAMTLTEARTYLGRFLFHGEDVFKKNALLSGGERSRLALAKLGLDEGNFLVLDEPTNHLDIAGAEEMEDALAQFPGTLLVVSHDRYFVRRTTDKVLEVSDGRVSFYPMGYDEYMLARDQKSPAGKQRVIEDKRKRQDEGKRRHAEEISKRRTQRKLRENVAMLEESIEKLEMKVLALNEEIALPEVFNDYRQARQKGRDLEKARQELDELYAAWDRETEQIEQMEDETK